MYNNLEGEPRKRKITREQLAKNFNLNIASISFKLNVGSRMKLEEAQRIRDLYFPTLTLDYLFSTNQAGWEEVWKKSKQQSAYQNN